MNWTPFASPLQQNTQNLLNSYAKYSGISYPLTTMSFG